MKTPERRQASSGVVGEQLTLIDPPPFCPMWPKRGSLPDRALKMFFDGRTIDHPDFEYRTESWRLGAAIHKLRKKMGWPIETIEIRSPTEHCPSRVIALYKLDSKYVALALAIAGGAHE